FRAKRRLLHRAVRESSGMDRPNDGADRERARAIGSLCNGEFDGLMRAGSISTLKRDVFDSSDYMVDRRGVKADALHKLARFSWTDGIITTVKFTIGNIVKQSRKLNDF